MKKIFIFLFIIVSLVMFSFGCKSKTANEYTVTFVDWDGTVLKNYIATEGTSAIAPADPERSGYTFIGWDKDFSIVGYSFTVTALYEENVNKYTVSFYCDNTLIDEQIVAEGSFALAKEPLKKEGYTFIGWDIDFYNVKSNLIVNALYEEGTIQTFNVYYYDYDGNLFAKKTIKSGESGYNVTPNEIEGLEFIGWNVSLVSVYQDIDTFPLYVHEELDLSADISATITFDEEVSVTGNGVKKDNNTSVTIISEGVYVLTGTCSDGVVTVDKNVGKVTLLLNNINLSSSTSPIQLKGGNNEITITALSGTVNTFSDSYRNGESPKSCINGSKDLVINGMGTIIVNGNNKNGIKTDEGLYIENVNLQVTSIDNGIAADKEIRIVNSDITVDSKSDCIKSNPDVINDNYPSNIYVYSGTINLIALDDGFQAEGIVYILGGNYNFNVVGKKFNGKTDVIRYNYYK